MTQKWPQVFKIFFLYMKILEIWDYLQLISCIYVYLSWNESILKKKFSKICFQSYAKNVIFEKKHQKSLYLTLYLTKCRDQTTETKVNH